MLLCAQKTFSHLKMNLQKGNIGLSFTAVTRADDIDTPTLKYL